MCGGTNNKPCGMCRCTNCGSTSVVRVIDGVEIASSAQGSGLSFTKDDMLVDNQTTSTDATASPNPSQQQQEKETSHEAVVAEVEKPAQRDDWLSYSLLVGLIAVTLTTFPNDCIARVSLQKVWYFGWITAVATGLGVLPFYIFGSPNKYYMGIANAVACGMMIAASASLVYEGVMFNEVAGFFGYHSLFRVVAGFVLGSMFIVWTKKVLDQHEDIKFGSIEGAGAQKMLLIVFVMTLHSLTEGIGIGVSFGGQSGSQLGQLISLSLALHNVPEGLAVALVLTSRGMPKIKTALWCVFTSLPQPLMAIPAYLFVERFLPVLPAGLGFASGAMLYVAIFELFMEAAEDTSVTVSAITSAAAFVVMIAAQELVKVAL